jgi:hypothetical protein
MKLTGHERDAVTGPDYTRRSGAGTKRPLVSVIDFVLTYSEK